MFTSIQSYKFYRIRSLHDFPASVKFLQYNNEFDQLVNAACLNIII